jgi:hypothetical protein
VITRAALSPLPNGLSRLFLFSAVFVNNPPGYSQFFNN